MKNKTRTVVFVSLVIFLITILKATSINAQEEAYLLHDDRIHWTGMPIKLVKQVKERLESKYPEFYNFRQDVYYKQSNETVSYSNAFNIVEQTSGSKYHINPFVLLTTVGESLNWESPSNKDLYTISKKIRLDLHQHYNDFKWNSEIRSKNSNIANAATYAIYAYFKFDKDKLADWESSYRFLTDANPRLPVFEAIQKTDSLPAPFIERSPMDMNAIDGEHVVTNSFFDHNSPTYDDDGSIHRFDGFLSEEDDTSGVSWYAGHDAYDYHYANQFVYNVKNGYMIKCDPERGALAVKHTDSREDEGWSTFYWHMDNLNIPPDDEGNPIDCSDVASTQPFVPKNFVLGTASNINPTPDMLPHLHFGVRKSISMQQDIDPFGWWDTNPDPWEVSSGLESTWLWWGDESGDGHFTVDTNESQAQLFQNNETGNEWHYVNRGHNEKAVYALMEHSSEATEYSKNWAIWGTYISAPDYYQVQAYWPDDEEEITSAAQYKIYRYVDGELVLNEVSIDQAEQPNTWVNLGEFYFEQGATVVMLSDITNDVNEVGKRVYFDALRWETAGPTPTPTPSGRGFYSDGIEGAYYNDVDDGNWGLDEPITWETFTTFVLTRLDSIISFDTGTSSPAPGVNGTFWSTRWEGLLAVPQDDNYIFYFDNLDDGARLYINNNLELESWLVQGAHSYQTSPVYLTTGQLHDIRVEFAQGPGSGGSFMLSWSSSSFSKEVIGPSGEIPPTFTPTPSPTLTPSPTPIPTNTSVPPTNTPIPTNTPALTSTPGSGPTSDPWDWWWDAEKVLMQDEPAQKSEDFSNLLSKIRDEVLVKSAKGDEYIEMIYEHAPEIMSIFTKDEKLRLQVKDLALKAQPFLESIVADNTKGEQPRLNKEWVEETLKVLEIAEKQASPALRKEIQWWKKYLPNFVDKTADEIWQSLPKR